MKMLCSPPSPMARPGAHSLGITAGIDKLPDETVDDASHGTVLDERRDNLELSDPF